MTKVEKIVYYIAISLLMSITVFLGEPKSFEVTFSLLILSGFGLWLISLVQSLNCVTKRIKNQLQFFYYVISIFIINFSFCYFIC
jgi:hypothetical protein